MSYDASQFLEALEALEAEKNISKEIILNALKEAMEKSYRKELGGDDADVHAEIDPESGKIELYQLKQVVSNKNEDDIDPFLEITVKEANALDKSKKYHEGDSFRIDASIDALKTQTALTVKSVLRQKLAEIEKESLFNEFKDKIGTIITGIVEKAEDRGVSVNVVKTSVYLPRNQMIGDERFIKDDKIKLFVKDVTSTTKTGARINVTRANDGFLKCLFFEEIPDIYNGVIEIKAIARRAGERSKVAVISNDPNVEPTGACIGQNGSRIQKIVNQLGNGSLKEKIDIISYSDYAPLYILESMKPAHVLGIVMGQGEEKEATVIVADDSFSIAIGRKGVNVSLAGRLTGYAISIMTESEALEKGVEYLSIDEVQYNAIKEKAEQVRQEQLKKYEEESVLPGIPEGYVAPDQRTYEEESVSDIDEALSEQAESEETFEEKKEEKVEEAKPVEEKVEVKPTTQVKTTTTLEDLEKSLEDEKKKASSSKKSSKKKKEEEKEEDALISVVDPTQRMSIYTEEELREMEEEENEEEEYEEEDIDYDEYDEYYDDER